jgi:hypothetical protein
MSIQVFMRGCAAPAQVAGGLFNNSESRKGAKDEDRESGFLLAAFATSYCLVGDHPEQIVWGYMVKRLSAYGGCLGGRRR